MRSLILHMKISDGCLWVHALVSLEDRAKHLVVIYRTFRDWADSWHLVMWMSRFQFPRANKMCVEMYLALDQLTQRTHPIHLDDPTTLSYLVSGMFQKKLWQCAMSAVLDGQKCKRVMYQVPSHSRHTGQQQHAVCRHMVLQTYTHIVQMTPSDAEFDSVIKIYFTCVTVCG